MTVPLTKTFDPAAIEARWYAHWEAGGGFRPHRPDAPPFTIVNPPPNVTGSLHVGHALDNTLQDIVVRYERLRGKDALWVVGTDHAGIATQMVVERNLASQGVRRTDMGRDAFVAHVWEWKAQSGGAITRQLRRLGCSMDWSREQFTMDPHFSRAVTRAFVDLYEQGLIYRDKRLVNWDPTLKTAISDLEVEQREVRGHFWHIRYPLADGERLNDGRDHIVVATTRPETLLADMAVAVNPHDDRYRHVVGKWIILPITGRRIPIVADEHADPELGSGAVKITPGHDFNDFEVGLRAGFKAAAMFNMLDDAARVVQVSDGSIPADLLGLDRAAARRDVVARIEAAGLLADVEDRIVATPHGDRSGVVIEPWLTDQWYVDAARLAGAPLQAVRDGRIEIVPKTWEKTFFHWLENIQPWCISRQLWWGHRLPVWYGPDGQPFVAESEAAAQALAGDVALTRDPDVLDTWFSSALWPFATLGWPDVSSPSEDGEGDHAQHGGGVSFASSAASAAKETPPPAALVPLPGGAGEDRRRWAKLPPRSNAAVLRARALRRDMPPSETMLWRALRQRPGGLKFRRQHPAGDYVLDFFCAEARLAIEVYGEAHDRGERPARDAARDEWLRSFGIATLRVLAHDVFRDVDAVVAAIVARALSSPSPLGEGDHAQHGGGVSSASSAASAAKETPPPAALVPLPGGAGEHTSLLARHYPNDLLISGFDILFFWDARMAMMGMKLTGEAPWRRLYLHGLVRAADGAKMSKSKGNVVDPLGLIDRYGADALRFFMAAMESQGRDVKMDERRVEGYRNFATKLWNAARFCQANGIGASTCLAAPPATLAVNRWIIGAVVETLAALDQALADLRFDAAANAIYHFVWDTVCDWYLELIKGAIDDETRVVAGWVLDQVLVMLHPFMPFVTEELWHALGERENDLIVARWPVPGAVVDDAARREVEWLIALVGNLRAAKAELGIAPGARLDAYIAAPGDEVRAIIGRNAATIDRLARLSAIRFFPAPQGGSIQVGAGDATLVIPLQGVIDLVAEKARLAKAREASAGERDSLARRLANPAFVERAKPEAVAKARADHAAHAAEAERLEAALARLG